MINLSLLVGVILSISRTSVAVTIIDGMEVDCSLNCVCCKGGLQRCGKNYNFGDNYCFDGCVDGMYGHRCHNHCPENCHACNFYIGRPCYTCKETFYDMNSLCNKSCSNGCDGGSCYDNGTCSPCLYHYEGSKCDICIQGNYGTNCNSTCDHQNCRCTERKGCDSCKTGFYGRNTFCQTPCSIGCQDGVCNDDGSCKCRESFSGVSCMECINAYYGVDCNTRCFSGCFGETCMRNGACYRCKPGYFGKQCNSTCSVGCSAGVCMRDGSCTCSENFIGTPCDACVEGKYGNECQYNCSGGCSTPYCDKTEGRCTNGCIDGYSGNTCTEPCDLNCASCQQSDLLHCTSCFNDNSGSRCECPPNCVCDEGSDRCTSCLNMYSNQEYDCKCHTKFCDEEKCNTCINNEYFVNEGIRSCCPCPSSCKDTLCSSQYQCLQGCEDGKHGKDCSSHCSDYSSMCRKCSQKNGTCTECKVGFYPDGRGICSVCSERCIDRSCNASSGRCIANCVDSYWGENCDKSCNTLCKACNKITGNCFTCAHPSLNGVYCNSTAITSGISVGLTAGIGFIGLAVGLSTALTIVYIRKQRRKVNQNNDAYRLQSSDASPTNTVAEGKSMYEELDKRQGGASHDRPQYEMLQI
ncbi:multiple epidermal growth factor-like domains protein 10 [Mya arenaria]|uniref:multiple epidermal growth factor-like domains protein 10 n=1 Tax=Mya arenaria TaxID=6604 RepID=UPI0022E5A949|nr:multiple epidermal growth factor-like domains protein 10 [Mya arenaria]XP_052761589.1 multiple epidermal growth factor-like domains protein 10 [Mya arenaria]XP_052761590.1 multiple epidermal growth factor-like domains protein 10 [Mya arenaria]XP_052761591.1 multiple epidermal growth factor-like domains protein 10 [Mya arenaria]